MARTPKQAKAKDLPESENKVVEMPAVTEDVPKTPDENKEIPVLPQESELNKAQPTSDNEENCITIGDRKIEIKPTKLKYFRNKTASVYNILKVVPINEFLSYDKGVFDPNRDADEILFNFLIAVFDDSDFVKDNYDNMTAGDIEKILKIFGRLNGIDDKEEAARKNREAQAKR